MAEEIIQKSSFIAIVGRPNVGKSTVLNKMIGQKVAIVSSKPQTTRTRIMGVVTEDEYQMVFIDTPGLIKSKNSLGDYMVKAVNSSIAGVDFCALVVEAGRDVSPADLDLIDKFRKLNLDAVLVINKIDMIEDKTVLIEQIGKYTELYEFASIIPVSAKDGNGMNILKKEFKALCVEGQHFFAEDTLTDQPERVVASEMVREKILRLTQKEIPHGVAVVTERMKERGDILDIEVTIYCEKDSHKGIIIGKGGALLKKISSFARADMEIFFGMKVNLQTWVKVKEDWRQRPQVLHGLGFSSRDLN